MISQCDLKLLIVKPCLRCTANCLGCVSRRSLHKSAIKEPELSFDQWKDILGQAAHLGLKNLEISGGEPTLYKRLIDLIKEGKKYDLSIKMNTNGSLINEKFAEELIQAGLDKVCISLYSHDPQVHNEFRRSPRLWEKATNAIRIFAELTKKYPHFSLLSQTIIFRGNYRSFDELIKLHHRLGSQGVTISYLEGDFEKKYLLNADEIAEFIEEVKPKLIRFCSTLDFRVRSRAVSVVSSLYHYGVDIPDLAQGIYWKGKGCEIPRNSALMLANGDVHPCNIVEYTHDAVMGNIFSNSLSEIWNSEKWNSYRVDLHPKCSLCPMQLHTGFPLVYVPPKGDSPYLSYLRFVYHSRWFAPLKRVASPLVNGIKYLHNSERHKQ
jgi:radical SAM protein with 4Fe4S-binding SPASM domain